MAGRDWAWLSRETGIPDSTLTGYAKGGFPRADKAVLIARKLGKSVEWLFADGHAESAPAVVDATEADWVNLPQYDLRAITDASKGNRIATQPVRKDWLFRRFGTSAGLWLAELPSSYAEIGLDEGDIVVCSDIDQSTGPDDNIVGIFIGESAPFVARYRHYFLPGDTANGLRISAAVLREENVRPIARIHARMLATL
jgi:hypothetical protein